MGADGAVFPYLQCVAAFRVALEAFELVLTLRQRRNFLSTKMRPEMEGLIPEEKFQKAQAYGKEKLDYGIVETAFNVTLNLVFYFTYFMPYVWDLSLQIMQFAKPEFDSSNEIVRTIVFCSVNYLVGVVTGIPFSLYFNFVIQEKYGFNRLTGLQYVKDLLLGGVVSAVIGFPAVVGLWYVIEWGGEFLWLYFWLFFVALTFFLQLIYPTVIAPLFNKFTPLEDGKLKDGINSLADGMKFPLKKIYVIDGSKRSNHSNAYLFGLFDKRIVLYDTLLEQNKGHDERILGVLCHELGHWALSHLRKTMAVALCHMLFISWLYGKTSQNVEMFQSFGFRDTPHIIGLLLFSEINAPLESILGLAMNWMSRRYEYQADKFASGMHYTNELAEALVTLHIENLSNMNPDPFYSAYHNSHPTMIERLAALGAKPTNMDLKTVTGAKETSSESAEPSQTEKKEN